VREMQTKLNETADDSERTQILKVTKEQSVVMPAEYVYNFNRSSDAQLLLSALLVLLNKNEWNFSDVHNLLMALFETFGNKTTIFMKILTLLQYDLSLP
jgi:hypothetical protein